MEHIQFRLRLDGRDWRMPTRFDAVEPNPMVASSKLCSGGPLQRNLFAPAIRA